MPKAYVIANSEVFDQEQYDIYRAQVLPTVEAHGGRFLVRGGPFEVLEGDWQPQRVVTIEFPSVEAARGWYFSPEYQKLKEQRLRGGRTQLVLVEGHEG